MSAPGNGTECWKLPEQLFGDRVCEPREMISYLLGLISILSWMVAEIPQLIRNLYEGNASALSGGFLLAWIIGDSLNFIGCILADVLPTQFLLASLYLVTTTLLGSQWVWYQVIRRDQGKRLVAEIEDEARSGDDLRQRLLTHEEEEEAPSAPAPAIVVRPTQPAAIPSSTASQPMTVSNASSSLRTRPVAIGGSVRRGGGLPDEGEVSGSLWEKMTAGSMRTMMMNPNRGAPGSSVRNSSGIPPEGTPTQGSSSRGGAYPALGGLLFAPLLFLVLRGTWAQEALISMWVGRPIHFHVGPFSSETIGWLLGWIMCAIYASSRIPQILHNMKRHSVKGLSLELFVFALTGNATYLASILVRSTKWADLFPKLPWMTDNVLCISLDLVILGQFVYFNYFHPDHYVAREVEDNV